MDTVSAQPSHSIYSLACAGLLFEDGLPPDSFTLNNKSVLEDQDFVRAELRRLEDLGCIVREHVQPKVVLPLS